MPPSPMHVLDVIGILVGGIAWTIAIYLALLVPECPWEYYIGSFLVSLIFILMNLEPVTPYSLGIFFRFTAYLIALGGFAWFLNHLHGSDLETRPTVVLKQRWRELWNDA